MKSVPCILPNSRACPGYLEKHLARISRLLSQLPDGARFAILVSCESRVEQSLSGAHMHMSRHDSIRYALVQCLS